MNVSHVRGKCNSSLSHSLQNKPFSKSRLENFQKINQSRFHSCLLLPPYSKLTIILSWTMAKTSGGPPLPLLPPSIHFAHNSQRILKKTEGSKSHSPSSSPLITSHWNKIKTPRFCMIWFCANKSDLNCYQALHSPTISQQHLPCFCLIVMPIAISGALALAIPEPESF